MLAEAVVEHHTQPENWSALLDVAVRAWKTSRKVLRDVKLQVGLLVHKYLVARLREEADGLSEEVRIRKGATRRALLDIACSALGISRGLVSDMVAAAQVVRLLSDGGTLGNLSYASIRYFIPAVERKPGRVIRFPARHTSAGGWLQPSEKEEWWVKEPAEEYKKLFRTAVSEGWTIDQVTSEFKTVGRSEMAKSTTPAFVPVTAKYDKPEKPRVPAGTNPLSIIGTADPRDAADMLARLVTTHPRRAELILELVKQLPELGTLLRAPSP